MYGRQNFVKNDRLDAEKPPALPRLLIGVAGDDVDQAGLVVNWLVARHGFLAAGSLDDLDEVRHTLENGRDLLIRLVDLDEVAYRVRRRGGFVLHASSADLHVRKRCGDYVLSVAHDSAGFDINIDIILQAMRDEAHGKAE